MRSIAGLSICAWAILTFGATASAGEWSPGNGATPVKTDGVANSICAFNGQDEPDAAVDDDFDDDQWAMTPAGGHVQAGGQFVAMFASSGPGVVKGAVQSGEFSGFGGDCRPNGHE